MGRHIDTAKLEVRSTPALYVSPPLVAETLSPALTPEVEVLAHDILHRMCTDDLTISTAESCTGGMLASLLTDVEGCGRAFDRAYVVYTNEAKQELLGVSPQTISEFGAVSKETALEMALGGLERSRADFCIAITGFAGRGAPEDEPGLVHFALAQRRRWPAHEVAHLGDIGRGNVRLECLKISLQMLYAALPH
ncbi:MAG: CinA family protein [Caulobacterales bacterium]